jgi:signal transduction histidine kinase
VNNLSSDVNCPRCGQQVAPQVIHCQHCGINIVLAAVIIAEQTLAFSDSSAPTVQQKPPQLVPEILVPRLGEILLKKKLLRAMDLDQALRRHAQMSAIGSPRLLGQILLEMALIDRNTLDEVITEQILQLHGALQLSNQQLEQRVQERTAELQEALSKLAELNQLKSNFIAGISHELRTPLTHLKGYLDLLSDGSLGELSSDQQDAVSVLVRAEDKLEQLIEDLIRFSLAGRGEFTLNLKLQDMGGLVQEAAHRVGRLAAAKQIQLEIQADSSLPQVAVDQEKMTWVILQLLDNAVKFTAIGGQIRICTSAGESGVTVCVADNGIGIPADRINEIFEPFHQLDGSDKRRYGGTGLGLALVRRILEAHGSLIKVQSEVGRGSSFQFTLPLGK